MFDGQGVPLHNELMNRRGFLSALVGFAAGATLDPERLLWVPGKKLISIPAPRVVKYLPVKYGVKVCVPYALLTTATDAWFIAALRDMERVHPAFFTPPTLAG